MAALVDTNVLVYRHEPRSPEKQRIAWELFRRGVAEDSIRIAHQAIVEFLAATSCSARGAPPLLTPSDARREAESLLDQCAVLYPSEGVVRTAIRGVASYELSWYDAHMWAYAETYGLRTLITEDLPHGQRYGTVLVVNPFLPEAADTASEPQAPYRPLRRAGTSRRGRARG